MRGGSLIPNISNDINGFICWRLMSSGRSQRRPCDTIVCITAILQNYILVHSEIL